MSRNIQFDQLRSRAIELRRAGKSRREIREVLGIASNQTLCEALRGEPPPEWTRLPNAKDEVRARARELRGRGMDYEEIASRLGVSKSSVSLWVGIFRLPAALPTRNAGSGPWREPGVTGRPSAPPAMPGKRDPRCRRRRDRPAQRARDSPYRGDRLLVRGAESKPCPGGQSRSTSSTATPGPDAACFSDSLDVPGIPAGRRRYRLHIHETADVEAATRYWRLVANAPLDLFMPPQVKRDKPRTVRRNTGADYHGCLQILVHGSRDLYLKWKAGLPPAQRPKCRPANI